jgi:phage baseplate assembly protein V
MLQLLERLTRRLRLAISLAFVQRVDDSHGLQGLQISLLPGEIKNGVPRVQEYGFTSVPEAGAEAIVLALGGDRANLVAIAVDDRRYRPTGLAAGETVLYSKFGQRVWLKADGSIELTPAAGQPVKVNGDLTASGAINAGGNVIAGGDVQDSAGTIAAARQVFDAHVHPEQGVAGNPTTLPPTTQM